MNKYITATLSFMMFVILVGGGFFFAARWNNDMTFLRNELLDVRHQMGSFQGRVDDLNAQVHNVPVSVVPQTQPTTAPTVVNHMPQNDHEISVLQRDISALQAELAQLSNTQNTELPEPQGLSPEDLIAQDEENERRDRQQFQALGNHFSAQETDNEWSSISSDSLQQGVETFVTNRPDAGTTVHNLECKQTLCVMDVEHNNLQDKMQFDMEMMMRYPENFSGTNSRQEPGADGRIRTVTYLVKKGEEFPAIAAQ